MTIEMLKNQNREKTDLRLQRAKQYDLETNRTQGKNEKSGRAEAP